LTLSRPGAGADRDQVRPRRRAGVAVRASAEEFAKRANAKLGNKAKVVVYGSSQLGGDKELVQKLKLGTVDIALPSTVMSSEADLFGVFEMPYLVKDRKHMKPHREGRVLAEDRARGREEGPEGHRRVGERLPAHHQQQPPINTPEDLKGIKLRVPEGKWRVKMFQTYGANPSPMKFSEVFTALQTGVMDGQENPFTQIYSAKFQEVQKFLSLTGHVYTPAYVTVGTRKWAAAGGRAQDPRRHRARDAGVRLREGRQGRRRTARQDQGGRRAGELAQQGRVRRRQQAGVRRVRQGSQGSKDVIDRAIALGK
jgi:TRAP-type transport system periplasmic protein